jgi:clan AA aspartic protease (TIGR02281 family)
VSRADRISFRYGGPLIAVLVVLHEDEHVWMVVDTGAQHLVISRRLAAKLGFDLAHPVRFQSLVGVGRSPPVPVVRLDRVRVGARSVAGLEASVYDLPPLLRAEGLLGLSFLRRFRVTFDFDAGVLILRDPPARRATPATLRA